MHQNDVKATYPCPAVLILTVLIPITLLAGCIARQGLSAGAPSNAGRKPHGQVGL
jgi:hypothetical protein